MTPEDPEPRKRNPGPGTATRKPEPNPDRDSPTTTIDTHSPPHRVYPGQVASYFPRINA